MALGQNIKRHRLSQQLSQEALSARTGGAVSQGAISALEKRDSLSSEHAPALAKALGVSLHELLTGVPDQDLIASDADVMPVGLIQSAYSADQISVPLLANAGSMGGGNPVIEGDVVVGALSISKEWVSKYLPSVRNHASLRFIHGYGDSMHPTFNDGDILLVDTSTKDAGVDGVYVLSVRDDIFIKRVSRRFDGRHEISSDNPSVKTVEVLNGDHAVEIKGRVVWCWNGKKL